MNIILQRLVGGDGGVFGVIIKDGRPMFTTLEPPWKNNQQDVSCIPPGTYKCKKSFSNKFQRALFELVDVPDREVVKIHVGNSIRDTEGCILLGMSYSLSDYAIINSKLAFDNFMSIMPNEFTITINDVVVKGETSWV